MDMLIDEQAQHQAQAFSASSVFVAAVVARKRLTVDVVNVASSPAITFASYMIVGIRDLLVNPPGPPVSMLTGNFFATRHAPPQNKHVQH